MKNLIISYQYFRRFHCQKKNICNIAEFTNRINLSPKKWCWKNLRPHPDIFKITSKNLPYTFQTTNRHLLNLFKTPYKYLLNTFQTNSWPLQRVSRHTKQLSNDRNPILTWRLGGWVVHNQPPTCNSESWKISTKVYIPSWAPVWQYHGLTWQKQDFLFKYTPTNLVIGLSSHRSQKQCRLHIF